MFDKCKSQLLPKVLKLKLQLHIYWLVVWEGRGPSLPPTFFPFSVLPSFATSHLETTCLPCLFIFLGGDCNSCSFLLDI